MGFDDEEIRAAQGLAELFGFGGIFALDHGTMNKDEQGWSGAEVRRVKVTYNNGKTGTMILKKAELKERLAMKMLTEDGHRNTPAAFSRDTVSDIPKWMAMQDLGRNPIPLYGGTKWMCGVAEALARIHTDHMGMQSTMQWLPHADAAYWTDITTRFSVDHFEHMVEENQNFSREFGAYLPLLRRIARGFVRDMVDLYHENDSLTLTHGDLQTIDGAHVYDHSGTPYIIDFGWCRYAPFYIDIAGYFSFEDARYYYQALISRGISLHIRDFDERLRAAFRYYGFIYLYPSLMQWSKGPTELTGKRLLQILKIILTGNFPERRARYSDELFVRLLAEHRQGKLGNC